MSISPLFNIKSVSKNTLFKNHCQSKISPKSTGPAHRAGPDGFSVIVLSDKSQKDSYFRKIFAISSFILSGSQTVL